MLMASNSNTLLFLTTLLLISIITTGSHAALEPEPAPEVSQCDTSARGECYNKPKAMRLKMIAIPTILIASMIGVCLPLVTRSVPALGPDRNLFALVKAFASGVILATGYMHVLPDSFENLTSPCLPAKPWSEFPFTAFVAMLSAVFTLMVDSLMLTFYKKTSKSSNSVEAIDRESPVANEMVHVGHGHGHGIVKGGEDDKEEALRRNRIIAQVSFF